MFYQMRYSNASVQVDITVEHPWLTHLLFFLSHCSPQQNTVLLCGDPFGVILHPSGQILHGSTALTTQVEWRNIFKDEILTAISSVFFNNKLDQF